MRLVARFASLAVFVSVAFGQAQEWGQCGGEGYTGPTTCVSGTTCVYSNPYYSQCLPGTVTTSTATTTSTHSTSTGTTTSTAPPTGGSGTSCPNAKKFELFGVNESCAEFGTAIPGTWGVDFTFAAPSSIDYFVGEGFNFFRMPFMMERMVSPTVGMTGPLSQEYLANYTEIVNYATGKGAYVAIDNHNYMLYNGQQILDTSEFETFWTNLASEFKDNDHVIFDIMNEPNEQDAATVFSLMQAGVNGVRAAGATSQLIFVEGTSWTGAWTWDTSGNSQAFQAPGIQDPSDNYVIEMHQYLDSDGSGTSDVCVNSTIGVSRLQAATQWLQANNMKGFLGEIGAGNNPTCVEAVQGAMCEMQQSGVWVGASWWAAGPWWGSTYFTSIEPPSGPAVSTILPQALVPFLLLAVLARYSDYDDCNKHNCDNDLDRPFWKWDQLLEQNQYFGVNQSGAEFGTGKVPGTYGIDFIFPAPSSIDNLCSTFVEKGFNFFRMPFMMERMVSPSTGITGPLVSAYLANYTAAVNYATNKGAYVAIDVMNEPYEQDAATTFALMQAGVNGIRAAGATSQLILVEGTSWTGAWTWTTSGNSVAFASPGIKDPENNWAIEMHQYLDSDGSGTNAACVNSTIGASRLQAATSWLKANGMKGFLGEFGAGNDATCIAAIQADIPKWIRLVRQHDEEAQKPENTLIFVQVSSVEEALVAANEWKVDVIVVQGNESGGHGVNRALPVVNLVPLTLEAVDANGPLILAAGGFANGAHLASMLALGADGAVFGTRFLLSEEALYSDIQKQALVKAKSEASVRSMAWDTARQTLEWPIGVDGRGLRNSIVDGFENGVAVPVLQQSLKDGQREGDPDRMIIWAGTGIGQMRSILPAKVNYGFSGELQ
ncbi:CBM1 domain-containing protein [Mycena chlorophos]|uniref:CBM1 domain-containing protein n=1 Tax=Mycena chlorophos TaxID=658473 RepID=A0A8H6T372_MYCCL|nr:CBM1 domain-containing protein [Mycena chlorophos]